MDVSPHLFRAAAASTAAVYGGNHPHLASALLNHRDPRVTEEHYNRAVSLSAGEEYNIIAQLYRHHVLALEVHEPDDARVSSPDLERLGVTDGHRNSTKFDL